MSLPNNFRELRFKYGEITRKQLAELVGVSRKTINAIENNKHAPTIDVVTRIADVFPEAVDSAFEYDYEGKPEYPMVYVGYAGVRDQIGADCNDWAASLPSEAL